MILDWKIVAKDIYDKLKLEVSTFDRKPKLAVILVWKNSPSLRYINQKQKWAEYIWIDFELINFDDDINQESLLEAINKLNIDNSIDGFMVQTPLPKHINIGKVLNAIKPEKDIDGFHPINQWKIVIWDKTWLPACTPAWIIELCKYYNINLEGKNVVIIWRSNIVWKPLANLLINAWSTVTVCNSKTKDISFYTKNSDIVITAMWSPNFLTLDKIKDDTIVIDVWFTVIDGKIYWDADFENISKNGNNITSVPGWVWTLTVAMLMANIIKAYKA